NGLSLYTSLPRFRTLLQDFGLELVSAGLDIVVVFGGLDAGLFLLVARDALVNVLEDIGLALFEAGAGSIELRSGVVCKCRCCKENRSCHCDHCRSHTSPLHSSLVHPEYKILSESLLNNGNEPDQSLRMTWDFGSFATLSKALLQPAENSGEHMFDTVLSLSSRLTVSLFSVLWYVASVQQLPHLAEQFQRRDRLLEE